MSFIEWLTEHLESLSIDGSVYGEYIFGILNDEVSGSLTERLDSVMSILESLGEELPESLRDEIKVKWTIHVKEEEILSSKKIDTTTDSAKLILQSVRAEAQKHICNKNSMGKVLSEEERIAKDLLIATFDCPTHFDDDGNPIEADFEEDCSEINFSTSNRNQQKLADAKNRKASKIAAAQKKQKDKEDLARDRQRKIDRKKKKTSHERQKKRG